MINNSNFYDKFISDIQDEL